MLRATLNPRAERRRKRVAKGLEGLDLWLGDLIRHGLAGLEERPAEFWEAQAARLVDAQAPGLATRVRRLRRFVGGDPEWPARLLRELGRIAMLTHAFRRLDALPEALQADVRHLVGWSLTHEEVLARGEAAADAWLVAGQSETEEERLRVQRTWLAGTRSGQTALFLQYAAGSAPFAETLVPGTVFEGELVYWPSAFLQRAAIRSRSSEPAAWSAPMGGPLPGFERIEAFRASFAEALARQPWLERAFAALRDVTPVHLGDASIVRDAEGSALPLARRDAWSLFALSGGAPIDLAAEWDGHALVPLAVVNAGEYRALPRGGD